jgi:DNA-directed RNA polymerase subunit RPC12/RpoP
MDSAAPDPKTRRKVWRKSVFGYGYLVTPGFAILGLALYDAIIQSRWYVFAGLSVLLAIFLFYLPLVSHFRCANCKRFFRYEQLGLEAGDTLYRCVECGHTKQVREWCGMTDIAKSSRRLIRK